MHRAYSYYFSLLLELYAACRYEKKKGSFCGCIVAVVVLGCIVYAGVRGNCPVGGWTFVTHDPCNMGMPHKGRGIN